MKEELKAGAWIVLGECGCGWSVEHEGLVARIKKIGKDSGATGSGGRSDKTYDVILDSDSCPPLKGTQIAGERKGLLGQVGGLSKKMRIATDEEIESHCNKYGIADPSENLDDIEFWTDEQDGELKVGDKAIVIDGNNHRFDIGGEVEVMPDTNGVAQSGFVICKGTKHHHPKAMPGQEITQILPVTSLKKTMSLPSDFDTSEYVDNPDEYLKKYIQEQRELKKQSIFKVSYVAKDGTTKKTEISASSENDAINQIEDFAELNFTIKE